ELDDGDLDYGYDE
ncbi:unnamed protein product, partial [Lathyrus sativus]